MTSRLQTSSIRPLFGILAVVALVASACGLSRDLASGPAATIQFSDGTSATIEQAELEQMVTGIAADSVLAQAAFNTPDPNSIRPRVLETIILTRISAHEVDVAGGQVSDVFRQEERAALLQQVAGLDPAGGDADAAQTLAEARFEDLTYLPLLVELRAQQGALAEALGADLPAVEAIQVPCASHILLESEDEANEVLALAQAGEDFAALAVQRSVGPSGPGGGALGCADPANYVPEFAEALLAAEEGVVVGPVQTQFGFHLILVTGFEEQPGVGPDPRQLADEQLFATAGSVTIEVDPLIGTWDSARTAIEAPVASGQ